MNTYDFNIKVKELNGKEIDKTLAASLSEFIGSETKGHTLKLFGWYIKLQSGQPLELDDADAKTLRDLIENSDRLYVFVKGQLLEILK